MRPLLDRIVNVEQGTDEWKAARSGKATGSRIKDVLAKIKSGEASTRRDYRVQLVTEILTGAPADDFFVSKDMQWGTDQEPFARGAYEVYTGQMVDTVGFVLHPTIARAGASPDGLVGWDRENSPAGLVQFKCPKSSTHLGYLLADVVPEDYKPQMLWEMAATGALWCDFVSFDPRMPDHLQLFIKRYHLDEVRLAQITQEVQAFLGEVQTMLDDLNHARPCPAPISVPANEALGNQGPAMACEGGASEDEVPL